MNVSAAVSNEIFLRYVVIIIALLGFAGATLTILTLTGKNVSSIWRTYRGWLLMAPLVLGAVLLGREVFIAGVTLMAMFGFREFAKATGLYSDWWLTGLVYASIVALGISCWMPDPRLGYDGWYGMFTALPAYAIAALVLVPIARNRSKGQLQQVALAIVGFLYLGWMFSHLGFLANAKWQYGYILFLVFAVEVNDVAAFTFGKMFGRHKLREHISPNKTIEGSLGAIGVSLVMPFLLSFSFPGFDTWHLLLTGLLVGIGGQLGDLVISYIKRDIGIKDMGNLIQGHGGILDRVDSMIFVAPIFFHAVRWMYDIR